jgi:transcriptional regulator with XRE-family HTH domain
MILLRHLLGDALRRLRLRQGRTLREVSAAARVSLGYLSEVERGQKEASSELLGSICSALGTPLSQVLREVSDNFALAELQNEPVLTGAREPQPASGPPAGPARPAVSESGPAAGQVRLGATGGRQLVPARAGQRLSGPQSQRVSVPPAQRVGVPQGQRAGVPQGQRLGVPQAQQLAAGQSPVIDAVSLQGGAALDRLTTWRTPDITDMVPV